MLALELLAGLGLLVLGGDLLVRGAVGLANRLNISPLLIGIVLVGFGTSTPELVTSLIAAMENAPGIAVGNIVGSNTANILLILGIAALIHPLKADPRALIRDGLVLALSALACVALSYAGFVSRLSGSLLLLSLSAYLVVTYRSERRTHHPALGTPGAKELPADPVVVVVRPWLHSSIALVAAVSAGLGLTVLGARFLVEASVELARHFDVSETVIGLTIVAVGTSLPELVTSVIAAVKRQTAIALGNIVGSNIYNVLGILGATSLIKPIEIPARILSLDIWVMVLATALLLVFARTGHRICRLEGAAFLGIYVFYTATLVLS